MGHLSWYRKVVVEELREKRFVGTLVVTELQKIGLNCVIGFAT
jgi:hypothetical protein